MLDTYQEIKDMIASIEEDVQKANGGNKAAGTRVRKHMQDLKALAQTMRVKVLEDRGGEG